MISSVLDMLGTAVGKSNRVGSTHSLSVRGFSSVESSLGVIISYGVLVGVRLGGILGLLVRCRGGVVGWLVDNRLGVVDRLMDNGSWVVGRLVDNRGGVVDRLVNDRGGVVGWLWVVWLGGRFVCWNWGVDNRGVVNRSRAWVVGSGSRVVGSRGGVVRSRGGVVGSRGIAVGQGSRSVNLGYWFFITAIPMDRLRSSMGLAGDRGMNSTVGLVDRDADRWGVTLLEHLVV